MGSVNMRVIPVREKFFQQIEFHHYDGPYSTNSEDLKENHPLPFRLRSRFSSRFSPLLSS